MCVLRLCEICLLPMSSSPVPAVINTNIFVSLFVFVCCLWKALNAPTNSEASPIARGAPRGDKNREGMHALSAGVTASSFVVSGDRDKSKRRQQS